MPHRSPLPSRALRIARVALIALLAPLAAACGPGDDRGSAPPPDLEAVDPPPDLAEFDRAVREQFERFAEELRRTRDAEGEASEATGAAWGRMGQWFAVYDYHASASSCYRNARRLDPDEPRWPYYLGGLAVDAGALDDAEALYRRAAELAPGVSAPKVRLADIALERQDLDLAERSYREVLAGEPENPGATLGIARVALARDRPEAALEPLRRLARSQPEAAQVNYTLSLVWRRLGDDARADEALGRVPEDNLDQILLDTGSAWDSELTRLDVGARMLTRRGVRAFRRGETERAAVLLGRAVEADPTGPEKRINYALALREIGRPRAAAEELRAALRYAEPGTELASKANLEMGRLLVDLGRPAAARPFLEATLEADPRSVPAHVTLGRLLQRHDDLEGALLHYAAVRDLDAGGTGARFWNAALLLALDRRDDALAALEEDLETARDPRAVRLLLARLLVTTPERRDVERARRLLAASGPADVLFAETAAMVAAAESRFDEATAWQEAAIATLADLPPRSAVHTARRRLVLYRRGKPCRTPWESGERLVRSEVAVPPGQTPPSSGEPGAPEPAEDEPRPAGRAAPETGLDLATADVRDGGSGAGPYFVDVASAAGLVFEHDAGGTGELYFAEPVGAGGALADLDGDGDLDVVLVQGELLGSPEASDGTEKSASRNASNGGSRIFRNDLAVGADGTRRLRFTDVTDESGFRAAGYGMGIATGDYDGDGRVDLYLTAFGHNSLWRNRSQAGEIRFEDVTAKAGVDDPRWSTSASFADLDGDGRLDLYVAAYVDFRIANHRRCRSPSGRLDYCGPQSYAGEVDRLFLNRGDGTFGDVSAVAGIVEPGSGLGVVAEDFDGDGRTDLYVANDLQRNFLWHNLGNGPDGTPRFENVALENGCAVSMLGRAQASMGVVAGDLDNDGDSDLFMTHLSADTNTLYVNDGQGLFTDRSARSGLGNPSLAGTGFGTALLDFDNDGWLDVFVANGAVKVIEEQARAGSSYPLAQPNQLYANRHGAFVDVSDEAGPELARVEVSRGVAVGDVDGDGRSDLLLTNNSGPARLLLDRTPTEHAWLGLRLVDRAGRDAVGARIEVVLPDGTVLRRRAATDGSYLSASDPRVLVGLGEADAIREIRVRWPDGTSEVWPRLAPGRYHTLVAGHGSQGK